MPKGPLLNKPRIPFLPDDEVAIPAAVALSAAACGLARPGVAASAPRREGLLRQARGIVIASRGACATVRGVSLALTAEEAEVALACAGDEPRPNTPAMGTNGAEILPCDPLRQSDLERVFARAIASWGRIDYLVHCSGPTETSLPSGRYVDMEAHLFRSVMDEAVHAFAAITQHAARIMAPGGSLLSLSVPITGTSTPPHRVFEVMRAAQAASVRSLAEELGPQGIRVNAIAAGPVGTAAGGRHHRAPLRRNVTPDEIGKAAVYLLSDLASGTTGETLHVDAGHHAIGLRGVPPP